MANFVNFTPVQTTQPNTGMYYDQNIQVQPSQQQPMQYSQQLMHYPQQLQPMIPINQTNFNNPSQPFQPQTMVTYTNQTQLYNTDFPPLKDQEDDNWKLVKNKKRLRNSPDIAKNLKQVKLSNYWLNSPPTTSNRYESLINEETDPATAKEKDSKPPPIFVFEVKNINPLRKLLEEIAKNQYDLKILHGDEVRIQPKTTEKYTTIVKALREKDTEFHTYKMKKDRSFKVVLKYIHPSTDLEDIKTEIEAKGHTVENIWNIRKRGTNIPLPLFYVELKPDANNKKIYEINSLLDCIVQFEAPHQKRDIPQCSNCQRYGHTKGFCHRRPRCVKCTGDHLTSNCPQKTRSNNVKCVLCEGNHPANYKGCMVYKEIQKSKYPPLRNKNVPPQTQSLDNNQESTNQITHNRVSWQLPPQAAPPAQQTNEISELRDMMKGLMEKIGTMLNLLTAVVAKLN